MSETLPIQQEIIIVRRGNSEGDGGHHGGAWKIAYADFVTAMMAFFLVMWLINSSNEVTKSRVASYFNPIKMTDATPSGRGLKTASPKKPTEEKKEKIDEANKSGGAETEKKENVEAVDEAKILQNPFAVIEEVIAKESAGLADGKLDVSNRSVGDPFNPRAWEALQNGGVEDGVDVIGTSGKSNAPPPTPNNLTSNADLELRPGIDVAKDGSVEKPNTDYIKEDATEELQLILNTIVDKHKSEIDVAVTVRNTSEGLLIMIGDNSGKSMFEIGSAKPSAGLIDIVGVIGKLLSQQPGEVVVRGHTDARKYRSRSYDNWQLSAARANMASYMLMRGGLPESRINRIEGHGAAAPLLTQEPMAHANRRVEFLLSATHKKP
jgi:chemotaxis protein MotB